MPVFVLDVEGKPLLPTCEARARILLRKGKAIVYSVIPFTIQLKRIVENPVGEFDVGIDDGAKAVGISVAYEDKVVFAGNIKLRQDVSRKMTQRAGYRGTRRSRKIRHRSARFLNRNQAGWLPPTIRQKKESILRVVDDLKKRINIGNHCTVEQGQFDTSSMSAGYQLTGKQYQLSEYEGNNWRQKVLWRDGYTCQHCSVKDNLQAHHIQSRIDGGTNVVGNGIALCKDCHSDLHRGEWKLIQKVKPFKYVAHTQQGKWYLYDELKKRFNTVNICYGWMTSKARRELGLEKDHHYDASAMIGANNYQCKPYMIIPRRTKVWDNNPSKTCEEKNGLRHYDIVKATHKTRGVVIGSVRSLKAKQIALRTSWNDDFLVNYSKTSLLWRPNRLIYC